MVDVNMLASLVASRETSDADAFGGIAHIATAVLVAVLVALTARKQRGADDLVRRHGWTDAGSGGSDPGFQGGTRSNLATGIWGRWPAERFQWHTPRSKEIGTQTWVEAVRLPGALPTLTLRPVGIRPKGLGLLALDRDSQARELRKYWYVDDKGGEATTVLTEHVVRVLLADDMLRIPVSIAGDFLFTLRSTWGRAHNGVEARLDFLTRIASAIPKSAYQAAHAVESSTPAARPAAPPPPGKSASLASQESKNLLGVMAILLALTWLLAPLGLFVAAKAWREAQRGLATNRKTIIAGFVLSITATLLLLVGIAQGITQQ